MNDSTWPMGRPHPGDPAEDASPDREKTGPRDQHSSTQPGREPDLGGPPGPPWRAGLVPLPGYRLVNRLGAGGFGEVWEADGPGGFPLALKFVELGGPVGKAESRALESIKGIRHPNLLSTFGAWDLGSWLVIAMELADRTLADRHAEARGAGLPGIPGPELREYLREAAKGIDFLNEPRHLVGGKSGVQLQHRDIKPANILLVGTGVKVADFGLVRLVERTLDSHSGAMTPAYAAPEFFAGRTSSSSDQYSLAIAYCLLRGGELPFKGTLAALMYGHLHQPPNLAMVPEPERPALERALAKEPRDRWPNCRALVDALAGAEAAEVSRRIVEAKPRPIIATTEATKRLEPARPPRPRSVPPLTTTRLVVPSKGARPDDLGRRPSQIPRPRSRMGPRFAATALLFSGLGVALWKAGSAPEHRPGQPASVAGNSDSDPGPPRPPLAQGEVPSGGLGRGPDATKEAFAAANAHLVQREYQEAIEGYDGVIRARPNASRAYLNRGNAYYYLGKHRIAIEDHTRSIALDPDFADAYFNRANAYKELRDLDHAIIDYERAIALDPSNTDAARGASEVYFQRGERGRDEGRHESAVRDYTESIRLDPGNVAAHINRGILHSRLDQLDLAIADYDSAIRLSPGDARAYWNRGKVYAQKGETIKSESDLAEARRLGLPDQPGPPP